MDLIPPDDVPRPGLRALWRAVAIGGAIGLCYGALAGFFTEDASLLAFGPLGGAFAGFLIWTLPAKVIWWRSK